MAQSWWKSCYRPSALNRPKTEIFPTFVWCQVDISLELSIIFTKNWDFSKICMIPYTSILVWYHAYLGHIFSFIENMNYFTIVKNNIFHQFSKVSLFARKSVHSICHHRPIRTLRCYQWRLEETSVLSDLSDSTSSHRSPGDNFDKYDRKWPRGYSTSNIYPAGNPWCSG